MAKRSRPQEAAHRVGIVAAVVFAGYLALYWGGSFEYQRRSFFMQAWHEPEWYSGPAAVLLLIAACIGLYALLRAAVGVACWLLAGFARQDA